MEDKSLVRQEGIPLLPLPTCRWENPLVDRPPISFDRPAARDPIETLRERLRLRKAERGLSARALSRIIGTNDSYIGQVLGGKGGMPSSARLLAMASELDTTTDWLIGRADNPGQVASEVSFHDIRTEWRGENRADKIPVFASGYCDDLEVEADGELIRVEQSLFEPGNVIQMIQRPPALWAAREAYAIYFHGSSMEQRFYQGEIGIVNPQRPPGPGDFVVVQLNDGQSVEVIHVLVKRLVRQSASYVELEQFNPPLVFRIDRKRVARMHLILGPASLYL